MDSDLGLRRSVVALLTVIVAPVAVLLSLLGTAAPAHADPDPDRTISGTVTGTAGAGVEHIQVTAYSHDRGSWSEVDYTYTDSSGDYSFADLAPGTYRIGFYDCSCAAVYLSGYWSAGGVVDAIDDAEDVELPTTGGAIADAQLVEGGRITGTLTGGGSPMAWSGVNVYRPDGNGGWTYVTGANTDPDGEYVVGGLPAGDYVLHFSEGSGDYVDEYYPDARTPESATPVSVALGAATEIDADLQLAGSISGTLTGAAGHLGDLRAVVYRHDGADWAWANSTNVQSDGSYRVNGLRAGDYRVSFYDTGSTGYLDEFYDGSPTLEGATTVPVALGEESDHIDATLAVGGKISGTVTDGTTPLQDISVYVWHWAADVDAWESAGSTLYTDADGAYTMIGLATGDYAVQFVDHSSAGRLGEYYDDATTPEGAQPVSVVAGTTSEHIDAELTSGGRVAGTVTDELTGDPVPDTTVWVHRVTGPGTSTYVNATTTDGGGHFDVGGLATGDYLLQFGDGATHVGEWWEDQPTGQAATPVSVTAGGTTTLAHDVQLEPLGSISGTVTDGTDPVSGVYVQALSADSSWTVLAQDLTDANGHYEIAGLRAGTYRLATYDPAGGYVPTYWPAASRAAEADDVAVAAGQDSGGKDFTLVTGATLSGTLTGDDDGDGIGDGGIVGYVSLDRWVDDSWSGVATASSDTDGHWSISGLDSGRYRLYFYDSRGTYFNEYWEDTSNSEDAGSIDLQVGDTVTADAALLRSSGISGTLSGPDGGVGDAIVYLYAEDAGGIGNFVTSTSTDEDGHYALSGLAAGTYFLWYDGSGAGLVPEYFDGARDPAEATPVVVGRTETVTGIDTTLTPGATIGGTVRNAAGDALYGLYITLLHPDGDGSWDAVGSTYTAPDGTYSFTGLVDDTYRVIFNDFSDTYLQNFFPDAETMDGATSIVVEGAVGRDDVDATMQTYGVLSGRVTDGTSGLADIRVRVYAYEPAGDYWYTLDDIETDANGSYSFGGLRSADYRLRFTDPSGDHFGEWWQDAAQQADATAVSVHSGETTDLPDAVLTGAGHLTGVVTDAQGNTPEGVTVTAYADVEGDWPIVDSTTTDGDGAFDIGGLPDGDYLVQVDGSGQGYLPEWWEDASGPADATPVRVTSGEPATIAPEVTEGGVVTGTVTDELTGDPIEEVRVIAYEARPDTSPEYVADTLTGADGTYTLRGLGTGDYRLMFYDEGDDPHLYQAWPEGPNVEAGQSFAVTTGGAPVVKDVVLTPGAHVSGTVVADGGDPAAPLERVFVSVYDGSPETGWDFVRGIRTDADGQFDIELLPPGSYRLQFNDEGPEGYLSEWWQDASTPETASVVTVSTGEHHSLPEPVELTLGGRIGGTVTSQGGGTLGAARIRLYRVDGPNWTRWDDVQSDADGRYQFRGLADGTYAVWFRSPASESYLDEYYADSPTRAAATLVEVRDGEVVGDIDAELDKSSTISGTVTDVAGDPRQDGRIELYTDDGGEFHYVVDTAVESDGGFELTGLRPGRYYVRASGDADHLGEWWDDAVTESEADAVVLAAGQTTDLSIVVAAASHVQGAVTDPDGEPLPDVYVTAYRHNAGTGQWDEQSNTWTDGDGGYDLGDLPHGRYRLGFKDQSGGGFEDRYWSLAESLESGDDVMVGDEETVTGKDIELTREIGVSGGPSISGDALVGSVLEADPGEWDVDGADHEYRWLRDGDPIPDATGPSYGITADDLGHRLSVEVTATKDGYRDGVAESTETGVVDLPTIAVVQDPTISGDPVVGSALSAAPGTWDPADGLTYAYQWLRGDDPISGADDATYDLTADDLGERISVEVTASRDAHHDGVATSGPTAEVVLPTIVNTGPPTIGGTAKVGSLLTATAGTWSPSSGLTFGYQWYAGANPVGTGTATYSPVAADVGARITVRVTASRAGHLDGTATSGATAVVAAPDIVVDPTVGSLTAPTMSGAVQVGRTVTASPGTWSPAGTTPSYQWLLDDVVVPGATGTTYPVKAADLGRTLSVRVTASLAGHTSATASSAGAKVSPGAFVVTKASGVKGKVRANKKLTVRTGTWAPAPATVKVQWYAGKKPIPRATATTLKLKGKVAKAVRGKAISVRVTVSAPGYTTAVTTLKVAGKLKR